MIVKIKFKINKLNLKKNNQFNNKKLEIIKEDNLFQIKTINKIIQQILIIFKKQLIFLIFTKINKIQLLIKISINKIEGINHLKIMIIMIKKIKILKINKI